MRAAPCSRLTIRVAPEHPYPAALEDAIACYKWLLSQGWFGSQIVLAGDSAGGGLAMCLTMYLRDHDMPLPAGIVAMSPWTDLTAGGESYETNYERDPLFGNTRDSLIYVNDYPGDHDKNGSIHIAAVWRFQRLSSNAHTGGLDRDALI